MPRDFVLLESYYLSERYETNDIEHDDGFGARELRNCVEFATRRRRVLTIDWKRVP